MELFLNILWVVMAAAALWLWRTRWVHQFREREHAPWRQWAAFVCALVLLFFMVSLTDDLHSELAFFEECSASRRHTTCLDCPHHSPQNHATQNAYANPVFTNFVHSVLPIGSVACRTKSRLIVCYVSLTSGRDPPAVSA
jgi:hypothetical protein